MLGTNPSREDPKPHLEMEMKLKDADCVFSLTCQVDLKGGRKAQTMGSH